MHTHPRRHRAYVRPALRCNIIIIYFHGGGYTQVYRIVRYILLCTIPNNNDTCFIRFRCPGRRRRRETRTRIMHAHNIIPHSRYYFHHPEVCPRRVADRSTAAHALRKVYRKKPPETGKEYKKK